MTRVCLGVGCERKPKVLVLGFARKPLLLFCHRWGIRPQKSQSIDIDVLYVIIPLSRLRLLESLLHFVESLQGEQACSEAIILPDTFWGEADALAVFVHTLLVLPLTVIRGGQIFAHGTISRIGLNQLLKRRCRFLQLPGYILIVIGNDPQFFPFAGMFLQLSNALVK
jgi:hypothetical protein